MSRSNVISVISRAAPYGLTGDLCSTFSISKLAEEKADISKMDWLLLNTRAQVLEESLKDDFSLPLNPTSFSYDSERQLVRISVFVSPTWMAKTSAEQTKILSKRATSLFMSPFLAGAGESSYIYMFARAPKEHCSIRFSTPALDTAGNSILKDVAIFESGNLQMK